MVEGEAVTGRSSQRICANTPVAKLQAVPALAATQVENVAMLLHLGSRHDEIDLATRVLEVLDDIAVGFHIEGIEELSPPLFWKVRLEVRNWTETRTRRQSSWAPGP